MLTYPEWLKQQKENDMARRNAGVGSNDNTEDDDKESTALTEAGESGMSVPGSFLPADFEKLIGDGFASIDTVMLGDPEDGKLPFYLGELIGPGEPIQINDSENVMPTWAFHPVTRTPSGAIGVAKNVTQIIPASYTVNAACARIWKECESKQLTAMVGTIYQGQGKTKKGRALNQFRVFEKYSPRRPV